MKIEIHADEIAENLFEESHDIHICFLSEYFNNIAMNYTTGYTPYIKQMAEELSGNALMVMEDIVKYYKKELEKE